MISCAFCKSAIDDDSFYCDQCGKEILLCETCHQPGQGQWCEEDGGKLLSARSNSTPVQTSAPVPPVSSPPATSAAPKLTLVNDVLKIRLDIQHNSILGRNTGPYAASIGHLSAISGKHIVFSYDPFKGWTFQDLGSTNKTKYHSQNNAWSSIAPVNPHTETALTDNSFLLVANVEFAVRVESLSPQSTQRI